MTLLVLALFAGCADTADSATKAEEAAALEFWPPEAGRGTSFSARIEASSSVFDLSGDTLDFGGGVTVDSFSVLDGWTAVAEITVAPGADLGAHDGELVTSKGGFTLDDALTITDDSFSIAPTRAKIGESVRVEFIGQNTAWTSGTTWASFGDEVDVTSVEVLSDTYLVADVTVRPDAIPGARDVSVEVGPEVTTLYGAFQVDRVGLGAVWDPKEVDQGETLTFTVYGQGTHFDEDSEISFFSDGDENGDIVVNSITVLDAENLYGSMTVSNAAELGYRDVRITTDDEGVFIEDAFVVNEGDIDLSNVGISLSFQVVRGIDNSSGAISEYVTAQAIFYIPLDPPCPANPESDCTNETDDDLDGFTDCNDSDCSSNPACGGGPQPYDSNGYWQTYTTGGSEDCPTPTTVGAGEHVYFESDCNIVTLDRYVDSASGLIYYADADVTLDDYCFGQWYDLHTEGEEGGIGEYVLDDVQPTVPADFELLVPEWWGNFTQSRAEDLTYTWTPAQTYPTAIFGTSISGTLSSNGEQGYIGSLPWDDGEHTYTSDDLSELEAGSCSFGAYSYIEGEYFGFPFSTIQTNKSDSILYISGTVVLE